MDKETKEKLEELREKIDERISGKNLDGQECNLNARDLGRYIDNAMSKYNVILVKKVEKDIKTINKAISKSRLFGKKIPYISGITPTIHEDGSEELIITFMFDGRCKGIASIGTDMAISFEFMKSEYSIIDTVDLLNKCYENFITYFNALDSFYLEYPNIPYDWGKEKQGINSYQELDDGFIKVLINSNRDNSTTAIFSRCEYYELSRIRIPKYGELYDFVDFYNDSILKSFKVDEEQLNPLFRKIVENSKQELHEDGEGRVLRIK